MIVRRTCPETFKRGNVIAPFSLVSIVIFRVPFSHKLHAINPTVGVTKQNDSRSRRDAVIVNRLQIGHTRATHAHLLGDDEAFCATCYTSLTVNHILIECPQFNHLRQQYHFGSTLKELFSNTSVNDIIAFIKDTHFYTRI